MTAFDSYDEWRNALGRKPRSNKSTNCLIIPVLLYCTVWDVNHHFSSTGLWCVSASLLFTIHTHWHITSLLSWSTDHRMCSDHSVWLRPHPPYQTGYRSMVLSSLPASFFFSQSLFFFLSHTRKYTVTLGLSVLMRRARESCLRQCRCAWGYLGLWSAPLPGTRNSSVSSKEKKREMADR